MKKQHVDLYRKIGLRRRLLYNAEPGAAYVPFIGDGDIADALYRRWDIYGADLDPKRVEAARSRLGDRQDDIRVADCNFWPFGELDVKFALADFDAYVNPYPAFISFWMFAKKADTMVLYFTDGMRQGAKRTGVWTPPGGRKTKVEDLAEKRKLFNFYLPRYIMPWFREYIKPYRLLYPVKYLRRDMVYWGAVIERGFEKPDSSSSRATG